MKPANEQPALKRRRLLGAVGTTGALVATAALVARHESAPVDEATATPADPAKPAGYRLTEHVQRYYQTTKI
jgi:hypothetical protein